MGHKCPEDIRHGLLQKAKADHQYRECGLENVQIIDCDVLLCPVCGSKAAILPDWKKASSLIIKELLSLSRPLFSGEIDFLAYQLRMKHAALAKFLRVNKDVVRHWYYGSKRIDRHSDLKLRLKVVDSLPKNMRASLKKEVYFAFSWYKDYERTKYMMTLKKEGEDWTITKRIINGH